MLPKIDIASMYKYETFSKPLFLNATYSQILLKS